ncbi:MAG TPA: biopolymer transporter ExbD [Planctomycetota bacterium]|nr:biopolymer transporter ExbD [Planctomycetota bacterium]
MPGYGYLRKRRTQPALSAKPQITSYADVTLALLVIFLVSAAAAMQMVDVALPQATNTVARDINLAVTISLSRNRPAARPTEARTQTGAWLFYFEDDTTGIEAKNLWAALRAIKGDNAWPLALIRADEEAPCELVAILIQCLQGLGVGELAFVIHPGE